MIRYLKKLDAFSRNIILVFAGMSLSSIFNLLYQLLIAHRLSPSDFAAFNALLSIFTVLAAPLGTLHTAVAKYTAEFNAHNQISKMKSLLTNLLKKTVTLSFFTCLAAYFASFYIIDMLKIPSLYSAYVLVLLISLYWIMPVFIGTLQGLELFKWFIAVFILSGALKLLLAFVFIKLGFNVTGALSAFLVSILLILVMSAFVLRRFISFDSDQPEINLKEILLYMFPVAITLFCWNSLTNIDMVLVRYYFRPGESGIYAVAQMVGKISLFLPGAITIVMFPKTSGLNAKQNDTAPILNRSLAYAAILCALFGLTYNLLPEFILKVLTGKVLAGSIFLGRLFAISMTFFALIFIIASYLLSIKDLRFIKYLVVFTILQALAIVFFHQSLIQIQWILCVNAVLLFLIHLALAVFKKR